jgi:Ca2+-binding EF-hand superfamily protein
VVVPDQDTEESAPQPAPLAEKQPTEEFTEEEILSAFRFLDLDNNNFVGASEIRHILICMGELITDEEVDVMIDMVDRDGDGQVCGRSRALL